MERETSLNSGIEAVKEIAATITATDSFDSIANLVLELALECTRAKSGSILLTDETGNLTIRAAKGLDPELINNVKVKVGEYISGRVAGDKTPLSERDINKEKKQVPSAAGRYKSGSFICCPMFLKDKLVGIININDKIDGTPFTEDELDLVNILSSQTAVSLENARLISELQSKARELDERNKGLIDSDRLKTEFFAKMTHELRTPLNSINGAVYYLKELKTSGKKQAEFVNIISHETNRLISLLEELLNFSRFESEEVVLRKKIISLKDIINEALSAQVIRDSLADSKVTLNYKCPEHLPDIVGEKIRLFQAVIHVLDGITIYTKPGDLIELNVRNEKQAINMDLMIKNKKIPAREVAIFFDERSLWYGIDVDKNKLKFYLAGKILEMHNGMITASNTSSGFRMRLTFPKNDREYRIAKINELLGHYLSFTADAMDLGRCSIMMIDDISGYLTIRHAIGVSDEIIRKTETGIGERISGKVVHETRPLLIEDIEKARGIARKNLPQYNTGSFLCLPITVNGKAAGVLNLSNKLNGKSFTGKDLHLASAIARRISQTIKKVRNNDLIGKNYTSAIKSMEALLNAGKQHKQKNGKLTDLVYGIMKRMGKGEDEIQRALYASSLYDLGLTQIDKSILDKTEALTAIEKKIIRTHPFPGAGLIDNMEPDEEIKNIILHHHERYDGTGYPDGLKGNKIPFISRVIAVADSYAAMNAKRPYRKALTKKESLRQIREGAGKTYDPDIVSAFTKVV